MEKSRATKPIFVGSVQVGGGAPVVVQSMCDTDTRDTLGTMRQINALEEVGCEMARVAVPDISAARCIRTLKAGTGIPLIADIHFDYRLALEALKGGIDCLRINPGNIGDRNRVREVVRACKERGVPIRIGVNAGSIPEASGPDGRPETGTALADAMVAHAMEHVRILEEENFQAIKISLKAFEIDPTVRAYRKIADMVPYPLHLGITESGTARTGSIRSAIGLGILLYEGIGDTIRVSLTADPVEEVFVAFEILKALDIRQKGSVLVSCPSCGRCEIELFPLVGKVEELLAGIEDPLKVAVMGCVVNGPGEARDADIGLAGGKGRGVIFADGKILETLNEEDFLPRLAAGIERVAADHRAAAAEKDAPVP